MQRQYWVCMESLHSTAVRQLLGSILQRSHLQKESWWDRQVISWRATWLLHTICLTYDVPSCNIPTASPTASKYSHCKSWEIWPISAAPTIQGRINEPHIPPLPLRSGKEHLTYLEFTWHKEFWRIHAYQGVNSTEDQDGNNDGKVADQFPCLKNGF